jgi:hypothetical protein
MNHPHFTWTVDRRLPSNVFLKKKLGFGGEGGGFVCGAQSKDFPVTFIPYALANVVLLSPTNLGQREGTLHFQIEPST